MGNKISPENINIVDVIIEKKDERQTSSKKKQPQKNVGKKGVILSGLFVLDDDYDYGQYVNITEEYSEETTGIIRQNQEVQRRNAIHPHLLDIIQSQFQIKQQQLGVFTLSEQ